MNYLLKLLPAILSKMKLGGHKKWIVLLATLLAGQQAFSINGLGSDLGIPSYDTFYKEPRDVLVNRVETARDVQVETAQEFKSALEQFKQVTHFDGGDLEKKFNTLSVAFERSEDAAEEVGGRVDRVVTATNRLLDEWRKELDDYHDSGIRGRAEQQFDVTRIQAEKLIAAMRKAEQKTEPVLAAFRDQVLFIKHNLNMQAISSLQQETNIIEQDVSALIQEMENSIAEAEQFIQSLRT